MDSIINNGGEPLMPPVGDAEYLIGYWHSVGMVTANGMGSSPISSVELQTWAQAQGIDMAPFEFNAVMEMSKSYLASLHQGEKPDCPPPYGNPVNEFDRQKVASKISNAFKAFIGARRK